MHLFKPVFCLDVLKAQCLQKPLKRSVKFTNFHLCEVRRIADYCIIIEQAPLI